MEHHYTLTTTTHSLTYSIPHHSLDVKSFCKKFFLSAGTVILITYWQEAKSVTYWTWHKGQGHQAGKAGGASQQERQRERHNNNRTTHNTNTTHNDTHTLHTTTVAPTYLGRAPYPPTYLPHTVWHTAQQLVNTNTTITKREEHLTNNQE